MTEEHVEVASNEADNGNVMPTEQGQEQPTHESGDAQSKPEDQEGEQKPEGAEEEQPWPKKAVNALDRTKKENAKLRAQLREFKRAQEQQPQTPQNTQSNEIKEPVEDDFETYGEFIQAKSLYEVRKELAQFQESQSQQQRQNQLTEQQQAYLTKKTSEIEAKKQEYGKTIPDFMETVESNADIVETLPDEITATLLEADDPALAFYNLVKSGQIYDLAQMNPIRAAMAIAQAQHMPKAPTQHTQAPRPAPAATGRGRSSGGVEDIVKDADKLRSWLKS